MSVARRIGPRSPGLLSGWLASRRVAHAAPYLRPPVLDVGCGSRAPLSLLFAPGEYVGLDVTTRARDSAERLHPHHRFILPHELNGGNTFASIAALAVLEHVSDPAGLVQQIAPHLAATGTLVMTTPHPASEDVYAAGARVGLFSAAAAAQHERLYDRQQISRILEIAGLRIQVYRRFMLGLNQLIVAARP